MSSCAVSWVNWITFAKDLILAGAAITASIVAILGLKTWRKQLTATVNADLSRNLLRALYRVKDRIAAVRNPFITGGEVAAAFKEFDIENPDTTAPEFQYKADSAVYQSRFNKLAESVADLRSATIEAQVVWGNEVETLLDPIFKRVGQLRGAIGVHLRSLKPHATELKDRDREKIEQVLYDMGSKEEPDAFNVELDQAIRAIEEVLRKHFPYEKAT